MNVYNQVQRMEVDMDIYSSKDLDIMFDHYWVGWYCIFVSKNDYTIWETKLER
jgi:hypothetical protein